MAGKLKADTPVRDETRAHNAEARKELIRKRGGEIRQLQSVLETQRAAAKGTNKEISDIYRMIKTDLGISRKSAEAILALTDLPEDQRDATIDEYRELFEALAPGEQASFLPQLDDGTREQPSAPAVAEHQTEAAVRHPEPSAATEAAVFKITETMKAKAVQNGRAARKEGVPREHNPWRNPANAELTRCWAVGWVTEDEQQGGARKAKPARKPRGKKGATSSEQSALQ